MMNGEYENGEYEDGVGVLGVLVSLLVYGFGLVLWARWVAGF